jgi:glycosyltransferase involved in cell wall biosynthesis
MSDNWEFALRNARGKFVTYIGDDDGFIPGAIGKAMQLIDDSALNALVWDKAQYGWPDHINPEARNRLCFRPRNTAVRVVYGRKKLKQVLLFREIYERLPCLYNGIVLKELVIKVARLSTNGIFFNSIAPDVFSGIALSLVIGRYLLSEYPFSVNGASRHSNGISFLGSDGSKPGSPASKFLSENTRAYDPRVGIGPSVACTVMGEYLSAREFLPNLDFPPPHWGNYVRMLIRTARTSPRSDEVLSCAAHTVRILGMKTRVPNRVEVSVGAQLDSGLHGDTYFVRLPDAMTGNIHDACQLIAGLLPSGIEGAVSVSPGGFLRKLVLRSLVNTRNYMLSEAKTAYRSL